MTRLLRRLGPLLGARTRWETIGGGAFLVIAASLELLQPWPIKWLIDHVFGAQPAPAWLARLWPAFAERNAPQSVAGVCLAIVFLALAHRITGTTSQMLLIRAGARLAFDLRCRVCDHLLGLSLAFHDRSKVGDTLYRVAYDTQAAQALLSGALIPVATGTLVLAGITVVMLGVDPFLTLAALAAVPALAITIHLFGKSIGERARRYHEREGALAATAQESLSAIRAVQAFTREADTARRFRTEAGESLDASLRQARAQLLFSGCVGLVMAVGTAVVVGVGADRVLARRLWPGDILIFLAYLGLLYQPLSAFSQSASVVQSALAQLDRVFEILDTHPEIADRPGAVEPASVRGRVEFVDVTFGYAPDRPAVRSIDFAAEPGKVVALVGRTGAGKTTVASLLLRFHDPGTGAIRLDGHDLRDLKLGWLRRQIGVVLQDAVLFSATIRENIAYGRPEATEAEIEAAARAAQADEFIRALPEGYDTVLGERGVNLSGGQRQRLAIARAFLKNAPILVLDEPTSALDAHTEEALLGALRELMRGRTTFIIAHRLSTVRHADLILVLDHGRIVERGTHAALLEAGGAYRRLVQSGRGA